jgi:outer membrane PBP1 activator LpoA protein
MRVLAPVSRRVVHVDSRWSALKLKMNVRLRRGRAAAPALLLATALTLALPALSVAQSPAASEAQPAPAQTSDLPAPPQAADPAPGPPAAAATPAAPARKAAWLALVLPLQSPAYGRAADAVREGFAAAASATSTDFAVIAHGDGDVRAAIEQATAAGARVIVGPLVRDDVRAVAEPAGNAPWVIALNQLDEGTPVPRRMYTLALAVDSEARQLARRARLDGAQSVVIVASGTALQKRFADAFTGEWILAGGGPPLVFHFDRAPEMLAALRREFARAAPQAVLLAVDAADAALVKPYLGTVAAYTSSQVNDRQTRERLLDLEDVYFVEIPWLADPGAAAFAAIPRRSYSNAAFERLYALGLDAFRVAQAFARDTPPERLELDGATGRLSLDASHQFAREAMLMQFRGGQVVPAGGR